MWNDFLTVVKNELIDYININSDYDYIYNDTTGEIKFINENEVISVIDYYNNKFKVIDELEEIKNIICD
jgi:hypothetical protein